MDWHAVDLPGGRRGLVGGFEARTVNNPPDDLLESALRGLPGFARAWGAAAPRLGIEVVESERDADLVRLAARVENRAPLPTGAGGGGVRVQLVLPAGAQVVDGQEVRELGELAGGEARRLEWLVRLPRGARVGVTAMAPHCAAARVEVRP
jgi:hypothetical protein